MSASNGGLGVRIHHRGHVGSAGTMFGENIKASDSGFASYYADWVSILGPRTDAIADGRMDVAGDDTEYFGVTVKNPECLQTS